MSGEGLSSPLMARYQKTLEQNPRSRVFAPLAESYRQLGMLDKAIETLKMGIRFNPSYVLGYLGMAFCYVDMKKYTLAYATLRPLVETNRDNIRLQKLFASVCEEIGYYPEALETYKYLLFVDPKNATIAKLVKDLEHKSGGDEAVVVAVKRHEEKPLDQIFDADKIDVSVECEIDDWVAVDFSAKAKEDSTEKEVTPPQKIEDDVVEKPSSVEDCEDLPVVTHTLVDIYCAQGYLGKAKEVLEKILELNPADEKTSKKLEEVEIMIKKEGAKEDEGHSHLMNIIDKKFGSNQNHKLQMAENKLNRFHDLLRKRAEKSIP